MADALNRMDLISVHNCKARLSLGWLVIAEQFQNSVAYLNAFRIPRLRDLAFRVRDSPSGQPSPSDPGLVRRPAPLCYSGGVSSFAASSLSCGSSEFLPKYEQ
jgi:hypothetical protein